MWSDDTADYSSGWGLIRITVSPNWEPQHFFSIRVDEGHPSMVTLYSLPKGTKYLGELIQRELRNKPCIDAKKIAARLPLEKLTITADNQLEPVIQEFFSLKVRARLSRSVRLDATEYDVEFRGDDILNFSTDDHEAQVAQWVRSLESAVAEQRKKQSRL